MKNVKNVIEAIAKVTEYNVESLVGKEEVKKAKLKLNKSVRGNVNIKVVKNERNEQIMIDYLTEIIAGAKSGIIELEKIGKKEYSLNYKYKVYDYKEKIKKEYIIKNKITNNQITREVEWIVA